MDSYTAVKPKELVDILVKVVHLFRQTAKELAEDSSFSFHTHFEMKRV